MKRCRRSPCASTPDFAGFPRIRKRLAPPPARSCKACYSGIHGIDPMNFRLLALALGVTAIVTPALAANARSRGDRADVGHARKFPASKWSGWRRGARCQSPSLAQHHRAPDRRAGRLGPRRRRAAGQESDPARRHRLGRNRRHGVLGGAGNPGSDPYRRRRPQRQQVHRQRPDLSSGQRGHLDRGGIRRQLSRRDARRHRRADRGVADPGAGAAGALRHSAERVYAHDWIDYKDARYCEGCALATLARRPDF